MMKHHKSSTLRHALIAPWTVLFFLLVFTACDGSKVVQHGPNEEDNNKSNHATEGGTDDTGHGPDPDQELIEPGFMSGSWRVADTADQALVANFDIVQEEGNESLEGYYTMGSAIYDRLTGKSGDISKESTFDGQRLKLEWNPTDTAAEMYTIDAQKTDEGTFEGRLTALEYEELDREVIITRYAFDGGDQ